MCGRLDWSDVSVKCAYVMRPWIAIHIYVCARDRGGVDDATWVGVLSHHGFRAELCAAPPLRLTMARERCECSTTHRCCPSGDHDQFVHDLAARLNSPHLT